MENIEQLEGKVELVEADLRDYDLGARRALEVSRPDYIFHLAAQSFVPTSWTAPSETLATNVIGQTNLFEAVRALGLDPAIQIACSSEEYGLVLPDEVPIKETNPLRPLSPYAVSKVAQDYLGYQYFQSYGIKVDAHARLQPHRPAPRRGVRDLELRQPGGARSRPGCSEPVIRVGNLDAVRDFTDVRDMVRAYWLAVDQGQAGRGLQHRHAAAASRFAPCSTCCSRSARVEVKVETDPARLRPSDVEVLIGDSSKFQADTGWEPRIPFEQTLRDLLDYWRERACAQRPRSWSRCASSSPAPAAFVGPASARRAARAAGTRCAGTLSRQAGLTSRASSSYEADLLDVPALGRA